MSARNSLFDARNVFAKLASDLDRRLLQANLGGALPGNSSSFYIAAQRSMQKKSAIVNAVSLAGPLVTNAQTSLRRDHVFARLQWWATPLHTLYASYDFSDRSAHDRNVGGFILPEQGLSDGFHKHRVRLDYGEMIQANSRNDLRCRFSNDSNHIDNA